MAQIMTKRGDRILIDDEDFDEINRFGWYLNNFGYALREVETDRCACGRTSELMHRRILGLPLGRAPTVDHINRDKLDNRRANLRICSITENVRNRPHHSRNKCGLKGVHWRSDCSKWRASVRVDRLLISLGHFDTKEEAFEAYKAGALKHHGAFANFD